MFLKAIKTFFKELFSSTPAKTETPVSQPVPNTPPPVAQIPTTPPQVTEEKKKDPKWYAWVLASLGKNEQDKNFDKFMSSFWKIVGLSGYKTIAGSKYAWCGLTIAAALYSTGYQHAKNGAGAKNWGKYGTLIQHTVKGIPHGAIVHINHGNNCSSSSGNHVALACGDYKPSDFFVGGKLKDGATITLLGGNQSNKVSFVKYSMKEICEVVWPSEAELPAAVTKTVPCNTSGSSGGTTR